MADTAQETAKQAKPNQRKAVEAWPSRQRLEEPRVILLVSM